MARAWVYYRCPKGHPYHLLSTSKVLNFAWKVSDALPAVFLVLINPIFTTKSLVYLRGTARMTCADGQRGHTSRRIPMSRRYREDPTAARRSGMMPRCYFNVLALATVKTLCTIADCAAYTKHGTLLPITPCSGESILSVSN